MDLSSTAEKIASQIASQDLAAPLAWAAEIDLSLESWKQYRLSANDGKRVNVHAHNDKVQFWKQLGLVTARNRRAPRMDHGRVVVVFRFPRRDMTREVSNLQPTIKALVDGLVVAGVFADDADGIVFGQDARRDPALGPLRVTILVFGSRFDAATKRG